MTCKEKFALEQSHIAGDYDRYCPHSFGYLPFGCADPMSAGPSQCEECWNKEVVESTDTLAEKIKAIEQTIYPPLYAGPDNSKPSESYLDDTPHILDSGDRTEFATGAVRDMREGKGRCDLLPLDVVSEFLQHQLHHGRDMILMDIYEFQETGDIENLYYALDLFYDEYYDKDEHTMLLEVAKHFEEGCKKYGENNWRKGIPVHCYIDSAVRHYLKFLRGDNDEPHDRAFCWNILCCIWTVKHIGGENSDCGGEKEDSR